MDVFLSEWYSRNPHPENANHKLKGCIRDI